MDHRLRFAPEILARLGEELTPHPELGIMELVRNAYDADATNCHIQLNQAGEPGGSIVISDNGDGMTAQQLATGYLLIGKSSKVSQPYTLKGRRKVGEKGLGRIAAIRLGTMVSVRTRPASEPGREYALTVDWNQIDSAEAVEDIPVIISNSPTVAPPGTSIQIDDLRRPMEQRDITRLTRSLLLLCGPFDETNDFQITCDAPEFQTLASNITDKYLRWKTHKLVANLDETGRITATLYNWRDEAEFEGQHEEVAQNRTVGKKDVPAHFLAPPARFEMYMFNLNPSANKKDLRIAEQPTPELVKWLRTVGGVHLYHRALRVQPYGDNGDDWLSINLRRAVSPEHRPSTNNSIGRILVDDPESLLQPKTDRSGFAETLEFLQLQDFATRALDWAAARRLEQRLQRQASAKPNTREKARDAEEEYHSYIEALKPGDPNALPLSDSDDQILREITLRADKALEARAEEIETLRQDLLLYRTLATVGTSTAIFAHEALRPAARIINELKSIKRRILKLVGNSQYDEDFAAPVDASLGSAETLRTFAKLPLSLIEKDKRRVTDVSIDTACEATVALFAKYLQDRSIKVELDLSSAQATVRTTIADIESILSNLLANSAHVLTLNGANSEQRRIRLRTRLTKSETGSFEVAICVDDTGPGIQMPLTEIWLPGRTTRENGTGLGLTIVRDVVTDLKGRQEARVTGELGGARVLIWLPARSVNTE